MILGKKNSNFSFEKYQFTPATAVFGTPIFHALSESDKTGMTSYANTRKECRVSVNSVLVSIGTSMTRLREDLSECGRSAMLRRYSISMTVCCVNALLTGRFMQKLMPVCDRLFSIQANIETHVA